MANTAFRVGVDGFNLAKSRGTGIATYGRSLTQNLRAMGHPVDVVFGMNISRQTPLPLRQVIFFDSLDKEQAGRAPKFFTPQWWAERRAGWAGCEAVEIPVDGRVESRAFAQRLPAYDRILNVPGLFETASRHYRRTGRFLSMRAPDMPAVMHWTYPLPIRLEGARNIYTVHDLVPLKLPYTTLDDKGFHYRLMLDLVANADLICTVSESSKTDILEFFPQAAGKLVNTYQALPVSADAERTEPEMAAERAGLFNLHGDGYFLFFGSLEPKKNIGRIIEAFLAADTERKLVIIGAMAWKSENELRFLKHGVEIGRILYFEYLPAPSLKNLVRGARAVLFPSLTEGFGLPVLEALALGTPVLTSREGALPEVAGEAALFADAYSTAAIAAGIARLAGDDAECARLRVMGPAQAARFSAAAYQERLRGLYEAALS